MEKKYLWSILPSILNIATNLKSIDHNFPQKKKKIIMLGKQGIQKNIFLKENKVDAPP